MQLACLLRRSFSTTLCYLLHLMLTFLIYANDVSVDIFKPFKSKQDHLSAYTDFINAYLHYDNLKVTQTRPSV